MAEVALRRARLEVDAALPARMAGPGGTGARWFARPRLGEAIGADGHGPRQHDENEEEDSSGRGVRVGEHRGQDE